MVYIPEDFIFFLEVLGSLTKKAFVLVLFYILCV